MRNLPLLAQTNVSSASIIFVILLYIKKQSTLNAWRFISAQAISNV